MQTFLPYPNFAESARVLDRQRLCKQRVECLQILNCLAGRSAGWRNHPAVKMWRGHEGALALYGAAMCREWLRRGYQDTILARLVETGGDAPPWLGDPAFHASHRAALLAKNPDWYGQFGWSESPKIEYVWPA